MDLVAKPLLMQSSRIPRWVVENDPLWTRSVSEVGMLKWTNQKTGAQAISGPTDMFCEVSENESIGVGLTDVQSIARKMQSGQPHEDIKKYLASGYLNPSINWPSSLDRRKLGRF